MTKQVYVNIKTGLHARPASYFVDVASKFVSDINISFSGVTVNAKSIIGVLSLSVGEGDQVTLVVDGPDEEEALDALEKILSGEDGLLDNQVG
nr:HPr family phosphocarrier protein [Halothermothrix orenii]